MRRSQEVAVGGLDDTWPGTEAGQLAAIARATIASRVAATSLGPERLAVPNNAAPEASSLPSWIGRFRPTARLRQTPLAEVFAARCDSADGTTEFAAVKRIRPNLMHVANARALFAHEAQLLGQLAHPAIPRGLDLSEAASHGHFVSELVSGQGLIDLVRRAEQFGIRIPLRHAISIVASIAEALEHVHTATDSAGGPLGIVHTDIRPANLMIAADGTVKLVDFGIARSRLGAAAVRSRPPTGPVAYMSPELSRGEPVDRRSDVYALGVMLWELSTWSRLYARLAPEQVIARVAIGAVPLPSQIRADIPAELEDAMMIALQPAPQRRFSGAGEFALVLRRLAGPADPRGLDAWIRRMVH